MSIRTPLRPQRTPLSRRNGATAVDRSAGEGRRKEASAGTGKGLGRALASRARRYHAPGLVLQLALATWLMRRFLFTSALPAGTDFLGFVSRARENASGSNAFSIWDPSSLGSRRHFTLETPLGILTKVSGDPAVTIKLVAVCVFAASGMLTYLLAWRWFRSRSAATIAGALYMTSQISLSQWASGHLNVAFAVALAPAFLLVFTNAIDAFTVRRALYLALVVSAITLARPDLVLYLLPFALLYVPLQGYLKQDVRGSVRAAALTAGVAIPATLALNLYQLIPLIGGVRAGWVSIHDLFTASDFLGRSVGAFPSVLGFGREIGYLAFTGQQTWYSHPFLPLWAYYGVAALFVAIAFSTLWHRRSIHTVFLAACALSATFMAKGLHGPLGIPYKWAVENLPLFGNLRDPNRWLIVGALSYSLLAALSIDALIIRAQMPARRRRERKLRRTAIAALAVAMLAVILPNSATLLTGFKTWRPTQDQTALLRQPKNDFDQLAVATVPFDQSRMFVSRHGYRGWEHDLGTESSLWTGHPALGDGGWHERTADFVAYTSSLLARHNPAFAKLLGSIGVKYLVDYAYGATSPHLVEPPLSAHAQQRAVAGMVGLAPVTKNAGGTTFRVAAWSPAVSFRPNLAVILGGTSGSAALATVPGVDVKAWAPIQADDLIQQQGIAGLLSYLHAAKLIVLSNERPVDLAVLATPPIARVNGITSDSGLDRLTQIIPSDASVRQGSLSDRDWPAPEPESSSASNVFRISQRAGKQPEEIWARVKGDPKAAQLIFSVDGAVARRMVPLSSTDAGFRWVKITSRAFRPGFHRIRVSAATSAYGQSFEVDETRVVEASRRLRIQRGLSEVLAAQRDRVMYAFDVDDTQPWKSPLNLEAPPLERVAADFWRPLGPSSVRASAVANRRDDRAVRVDLIRSRPFHTFLTHRFSKPQDWSKREYIFLKYRGAGNGADYRLAVDFDSDHLHSASYTFTDSGFGWRTRAFSIRSPELGESPFDWSHVFSIRIASDSRQVRDRLDLQVPSLSRPAQRLKLQYPILRTRSKRSLLFSRPNGRVVRRRLNQNATKAQVAVPASFLGRDTAVTVLPGLNIQATPAVPVSFRRTSATSYEFTVNSRTSGVLVLDQGYDERWKAATGKGRASPVPVLGTVNGYLVGAGQHSGSIRFKGQGIALIGIWLSIGFALGIGAWLWLARRRTPSDR
jgi:hypothetical protein